MAYNPYYPATYQQQYGSGGLYNPYQGYAGQINAQQPTAVQGQTQSISFIPVRSAEEAYNWPIAPGNSLTFKDESAPYIYTKTKGFSQLEQPIFEKFRLVKEDGAMAQPENSIEQNKDAADNYDVQEQIQSLWDEIDSLKSKLDALKQKPKKQVVKKEVEVNEQQDAE